MPVHRSGVKRMRTGQKRHARNVAAKSELKTLFKKLDQLCSKKSIDEAKELVQIITSKLDKVATKGIIHKKKASRKKSRLAKKLNRLLSTQPNNQ